MDTRFDVFMLGPCQQSGIRRLRDAIIFGFQLQGDPGREDAIPDWYLPDRANSPLLPVVKSDDIEVLSRQNSRARREL